jgi:hypothetical protein
MSMSVKKKKAAKLLSGMTAKTPANALSGTRESKGKTAKPRKAEAADGSLLSHLLAKTRLVLSPLRKAEA